MSSDDAIKIEKDLSFQIHHATPFRGFRVAIKPEGLDAQLATLPVLDKQDLASTSLLASRYLSNSFLLSGAQFRRSQRLGRYMYERVRWTEADRMLRERRGSCLG
jgi:hypothetical protein